MIAIMVLDKQENQRMELKRDIIFQLSTFLQEELIVIELGGKPVLKMFVGTEVECINFDIDVYTNFFEMKRDFKDFIAELEIDTVFIIGFYCDGNVNIFNSRRLDWFYKNAIVEKRYKYFCDKTKRSRIIILLFILWAFSELHLNIIHYALCTSEPRLDYCFDGFKNYKRYGPLRFDEFPYAPFYEYTMEWEMDYFKKPKLEYFIFGGTKRNDYEYFDGRPFLKSMEENMARKGYEFYCITDNKHRRFTSQYDYYKRLGESKYTYIPPSNAEFDFSIFRFMEAMMLDCVPMVDKQCYMFTLAETFPDICEIIKNNLVLNRDYVSNRVYMYESDMETLKLIKDTKSYRKITSYESVKRFFDGLMREIGK